VLYIIEVNPRASRTIPFVSKATGIPWARIAARLLVGGKLSRMELPDDPRPQHISVKAVKFPFARFDSVNHFLGPEMRSTGEVMGIGQSFGEAFAKAQAAVDAPLPDAGGIFVSVNDRDKERIIPLVRQFYELGFKIWATEGTCARLQAQGIPTERIFKVNEGRPSVLDLIINGEIRMIVNTPLGRESHYDEKSVGAEAYRRGIPNITTLSGASAAIQAISTRREGRETLRSLQEWNRRE
jgi:carbamoyl-phosphate synthase large subunit